MPRDKALALLKKLKEELDAADPAAFMALTTDLREGDFTLIGKVVQTYCFADLNARRIIDTVRGAIGQPQNGSKLNDKDVLLHLTKVSEALPVSNMREGIIKAVATVEMHREHRHNFAHWAVRRVKGQDIFVMFTKNSPEANRRGGVELSADEVIYALVHLGPLREELNKLIGHAKYLAETAAYLEDNLDPLKEHFRS